MNDVDLQFQLARSEHAKDIAPLVYESSHELLDFMFGGRSGAEAGLTTLLRKSDGHFGHRFATLMLLGDEVVGVELGYDRQQLAGQEFAGALNMLRAMPLTRWPHLTVRVNQALAGYVMPPAADAYYINNIAVDSSKRGMGLGRRFLDHIADRARRNGYRCVELDVTDINEGGIRFYERYGFRKVAESGTAAKAEKYGLPKLLRMRYVIDESERFGYDNYGHATSSIVVNDISGLNPVKVDDVFAPGTVEQLQSVLKVSDKPISIGGGRFSMGGHTAENGTLHVDMRGLNRVLEVDSAARTVRVEAGARWKDVQQVVGDYGLAVRIMQTYSSFTVGGSLSVNCHGRYVGLGPLILSVASLKLMLHDGSLVDATPTDNTEIFYGAIGGYGALGIIVEATLDLAENTRIERLSRKMSLTEYPAFFGGNVRSDDQIVFHNADMVPPKFDKVRAISWRTTDKPSNTKESDGDRKLYLAERYMLWAITETPLGHFRREYIYETLLYLRPKITWRNDEADYDVAELEPLSRRKTTYVLQEYFVPVESMVDFASLMTEILNRFSVQVVNVSIRHAHKDPGSMLAWARQEVFALVLYYKQGTLPSERESVAVWTRELIEAVLRCGGTYYLPYQPHGRTDQFHRAYPEARKLFALKEKLDPNYRFRNCLWEKYFRRVKDEPLFGNRETEGSEFLTVYGHVRSRDDFFRFLQVIYHLYPEAKFHQLIIDACERNDSDEAIYNEVARRLPDIKTFLSELTYALPALKTQKREMVSQTASILPGSPSFEGYLEVGSTGRYVKPLKEAFDIDGPVYLTNDVPPDNSPPEIMERGGIAQVGEFFALNDYEPVPAARIANESVDLVTCYIGLHHCPREKLAPYLQSIHRLIRPGGYFVLRDHDAGTDAMRTFCSLVHTVFNAGLGVPWEEDRKELRLFEGVDFWADALMENGFEDKGKRLLQANDPSLNTLMCFQKPVV
ncbi:MAG: GNAT family N-acetyltransferase [Pseudomonadota bacterium]